MLHELGQEGQGSGQPRCRYVNRRDEAVPVRVDAERRPESLGGFEVDDRDDPFGIEADRGGELDVPVALPA